MFLLKRIISELEVTKLLLQYLFLKKNPTTNIYSEKDSNRIEGGKKDTGKDKQTNIKAYKISCKRLSNFLRLVLNDESDPFKVKCEK